METSVRDYRKRQRLLKEKLTDEDLEDFKERNLSDTQYITRAIYHLLNDYLKFAKDSPFREKASSGDQRRSDRLYSQTAGIAQKPG